jgi:hypothetical protein
VFPHTRGSPIGARHPRHSQPAPAPSRSAPCLSAEPGVRRSALLPVKAPVLCCPPAPDRHTAGMSRLAGSEYIPRMRANRGLERAGGYSRIAVLVAYLTGCNATDGQGAIDGGPSTTETTIGPAGGTVTVAGSLTLSFPAGAVASDTLVSIAPIPYPLGDQSGTPAGPAFEIKPVGLELQAPATVNVALFAEQGAAANTAPLLFLAHEPNLFTIITATESANHTLEAQIETLGRLGTLNSKRDLLQVIADADTCSSGVALALAKQIVRYMNRGSNISLEPFSHENIRVATDALAYLQPAAATSLENIVATGNANGDAQITITAALRTVAQQFLLYNFYLTNDD